MTSSTNHTRNCGNQRISILLVLGYWHVISACISAHAAGEARSRSQPEFCDLSAPQDLAPVSEIQSMRRLARGADQLFERKQYESSIREFKNLYTKYPSCYFLLPIIAAHIKVNHCRDAAELINSVPFDNTVIRERQGLAKELVRRCPNAIGDRGLAAQTELSPTPPVQDAPAIATNGDQATPPSAPVSSHPAATSTENSADRPSGMAQMAPPPADQKVLPAGPVYAKSAAAPSERHPWYRRAWPWITIGGAVLTTVGIGIGTGIGVSQRQSAHIPYSDLYVGPPATSFLQLTN